MPWQETSRMLERHQFIESWLGTGDVSRLSRSFGISRQAVSKWSAAKRVGGTKSLASKGKPGRKSASTSAEALLAHHGIGVVFLLGYAPQLNPTEWLWATSNPPSWPLLR